VPLVGMEFQTKYPKKIPGKSKTHKSDSAAKNSEVSRGDNTGL